MPAEHLKKCLDCGKRMYECTCAHHAPPLPAEVEAPSAHAQDLSKLLVSIRTMPDTCLWGLAADRKTLYRRYTPQGVGSVGFKWYAEPGPQHDSPIRQIEPGPDGYIRSLHYDGAIFTREPETGTAKWVWKRTNLVIGVLDRPVTHPQPAFPEKLAGSV